MKAYINSVAGLEPYAHPASHFSITEPKYTDVIPPAEARRLSRFTKMGLYVSQKAIEAAGTPVIDAITVGSGWGAFESFERFERSIVTLEEESLSPTPFIQALPSVVSGQIALQLHCYGYNMTHVHRGYAFESALLDGLLLLEESTDYQHILVGGIDELTPTYVELLKETTEQIPGEGTTFLVMASEATPTTKARLHGIELLFEPSNVETIESAVSQLLADAGLQHTDISVVFSGVSGHDSDDQLIRTLEDTHWLQAEKIPFKQQCGTYQTSTAYALWKAIERLEQSQENILIINQFQNSNYSLLLLSNP